MRAAQVKQMLKSWTCVTVARARQLCRLRLFLLLPLMLSPPTGPGVHSDAICCNP